MYPAQETNVQICVRNHVTQEFHNLYNLGQNTQRFMQVYCEEVRAASLRFVPFSMNPRPTSYHRILQRAPRQTNQ